MNSSSNKWGEPTMTRQFTQLITHWDADQALSVIQFLDELRDVLWLAYGDEILAKQVERNDRHDQHTSTEEWEIEDDIPF